MKRKISCYDSGFDTRFTIGLFMLVRGSRGALKRLSRVACKFADFELCVLCPDLWCAYTSYPLGRE